MGNAKRALTAFGLVLALLLGGFSLTAYGQTTILRARTMISGNFLFSPDNTYDIGASGATRPRNLFVATNGTFGGILQFGTQLLSGSRGGFNFPSDGVITVWNNANTAFTRMNFGGVTASFPALTRNAAVLEVKLADDSAYAQLNTGPIAVQSGSFYMVGTIPILNAGIPTVSSGFGTSPTVVGRVTAFRLNVGTGGVATGGVMNTILTGNIGWNCVAQNLTALAANRANEHTVMTASTTTTVTFQNQLVSTGAAQVWVASDILAINCIGY